MSSRLSQRLSRLAIRAYEGGLRRRPAFRYWAELEASQWWPRERMEALRLERLRALLAHAERHVPAHAERFAAHGLRADALRSVADLARWPILERDELVARREAFRTTDGRALIAKATGGSSGTPLRFDLCHESNERRMAAWHRGYGWAGAAPGTRQWYLWGVPPAATADWRKRKGRLYDRLYRRTTESCFDLGEASVDRFVASLERTRPDAIVAYTNAIYSFARMLEVRGIVPFAPASIVVGAEKLHEFQREVIERVFRAPVFETYGSREFMLIGAECAQHAGLHLTAEQLVVEVVDESGHPVPAGVEGDVLVTDLTNYGMPFIRYRNGDRAVMAGGACACGRSLPLLRAVTGRRLDVLVTPEGGRLPGEFFPHILKERPAVQRFQVVQEVPEAVTVRLVAPGWSEGDSAWLRREVAATAGSGLRLDIEQVGEIPLTGAGKLQVVVNRLGRGGVPEGVA